MLNRTLTRVLCLALGLPCGAQEPHAQPRPEPLPPPRVFSLDRGTLRIKPGEPLPALDGSVTVEELGIRIPPPPPSPRYAFQHFHAIGQECSGSLDYLGKQLDRLLADQAADVARMRAEPEAAAQGMDTPLFLRLQALVKDRTLDEAESAFISQVKALKLKQAESVEGARQIVDSMWTMNLSFIPRWTGPATLENARRVGRQIRTEDDQRFLDQYGAIFRAYSEAVQGYVGRVVAALDLPETRLPLSELVLARLCKIRILGTYLVMTKANFQVWASSAGTGGLEPLSPADASLSALPTLVK